MKYSTRTLLILIALCSVVTCLASRYFNSPPPKPLDVSYGSSRKYVYGKSDTHSFSAELDIEDVSKLPKWNRRNPNPPVSINDAMLAGQDYRDQIVAAKQFPDGSRITESRLSPFDPQNGIWFWTVTFCVEQGGSPIEEIEIAVLMDGSVVPHTIRRRTDTGWPPPDQPVAKHNSNLTDGQVVAEFIDNLNVDRKYAGQVVKLAGTVENIPDGHGHRKSGVYQHFKSNDGHTLIFWFPHSVPRKWLDGEVKITGKLLGFRDLGDDSESWDGLTLFPGIRATSVGF